jgi:hypothetical protein
VRQRPILFFVSLCLLATGSFFAVRTFTSKGHPYSSLDASIVEQAKAKVPEPPLPPKPAGRVVTVIEKKQVTKDVPIIKHERMTIGGFITTTVPRVTVEKRTETIEVPVQKLVEASPSEIAAWNESIEEGHRKYQADLDATINALVQEKKAKERSETVEATIKVIKEGVVPLLGAVTGLLGAIKAFRSGREKKAVKPRKKK